MPTYEITVHGKPVAQPRPKVRVMLGSMKQWQAVWRGSVNGLWQSVRKMASGQAYVPEKHPVHAWRRKIGAAVRNAIWEKQLAQPLRVHAVFVFPRPSNMVWKTKPMPRVWYDKKTNDADNLLKAVLDAVNDCGVWPDDGLVVDARAVRVYAAGGEPAGLHLTIETLEGVPD